jgi:DNA-binding winged helix-turn-helix (wHTH) protein
MLLLRANEVASRDRLVEGVWGDQPPKSAGHVIESYVSRLRQALGHDGRRAELVTATHGYSRAPSPGSSMRTASRRSQPRAADTSSEATPRRQRNR